MHKCINYVKGIYSFNLKDRKINSSVENDVILVLEKKRKIQALYKPCTYLVFF